MLGTQKVIVQEFQQLAAGLPYKLVARTHNHSVLPDNLRYKFRYTLGTEVYGRENSRLITFEQSLPELAGKKLAMSFKPATQDDEDLIASYMPAPDPETGEIDPSQLPNTLPGYLINLTGEFTSNGEVIESAAAGTMGGELYETLALWAPGRGWRSAVNHPIAGEYRAIGLDLQGVSYEEIEDLAESRQEIRDTLEGGDTDDINILTKHDLIGETLFTGVLSYFAVNDLIGDMEAKSADIVTFRLPSFGIFSTGLTTQYWFGIPRNVNFSGWVIDIDHHSSQSVSITNNSQAWINFNQTSGLRLSTMEHLIPEQLFSTETTTPKGMSAVKAIGIAHELGQRLYVITQNNLDHSLESIHLGDNIETEIRNAVLSGKVVRTHQSEIIFNGDSHVGYIMTDPNTGAGAYKITSGENGGVIDFVKAVAGQPSLLYPVCNGTFMEQTIDNFINTNAAIWGITAPITSNAVGGMTLLTAIKLAFKNPIFLLGNLRIALFVSLINFLLVSLAWEFGVLVGSAISAAACRRPKP